MAFLLFACEDGHNRQGLGHHTARMSSAGFAVSPFISLRGIPQPSAQQILFAHNLRTPRCSAQEAAGVSRSEIKEETAKPSGDIREGSRSLTLGSGTNDKTIARRRTVWAH